jgi:hypothetical protein
VKESRRCHGRLAEEVHVKDESQTGNDHHQDEELEDGEPEGVEAAGTQFGQMTALLLDLLHSSGVIADEHLMHQFVLTTIATTMLVLALCHSLVDTAQGRLIRRLTKPLLRLLNALFVHIRIKTIAVQHDILRGSRSGACVTRAKQTG